MILLYLYQCIVAFALMATVSLHAEQMEPDNQSLSSNSAHYDDVILNEEEYQERDLIIKEIILQGIHHTAPETILPRIPFKKGDIFMPEKTNTLINNLFNLGFFSDIQVLQKINDDDSVTLLIKVQEKLPVQELTITGNKNIPLKDINKKLHLDKVQWIVEPELAYYVKKLQRLYQEKNYHHTLVTPTLTINNGKACVTFDIDEKTKSLIKRVKFCGNCTFTAKKLRSIIFTREDWPLSFMDGAGMYHPDAVEQDKNIIENFYQNNGYLNAKVVDTRIEEADCNEVTVTFFIEEGDLYTVSSVSVPDVNECVAEDYILQRIPVKAGEPYSRNNIKDTIELLRNVWGEFGYIYADIAPSIQPNDETKTVDITFYTELGNRIILNRINIIGNAKTRDRIIRRQILLNEGDIVTTQRMNISKQRVENLGFFDQREGVVWKTTKLNENNVDLTLIVREIKTGKFDFQLGFGGTKDISNPTESIRAGVTFSDTNFFGQGIGITVNGAFSKKEQEFLFNVTQPWLFEKPIFTSIDAAARRSVYDEIKSLQNEVDERVETASASLGYVFRSYYDTRIVGQFGYENIHFGSKPEINLSRVSDLLEQEEILAIANTRFVNGSFFMFNGTMGQDTRNHPVHPSRGYQWLLISKLGLPNDRFAFFKANIDASWYTPLIGERDLIFCLHAHLGTVNAYANKDIPWRELYHIGGIGSVRGYTFGQIGPTWKGDSIGAKYAFWLNAEIIFPIKSDFSMKGIIFYDGGSGWSTPMAGLKHGTLSSPRIQHNGFDYRHSIGFGLKLYKPSPLRVDWGFKLDRRKGESAHEVHLGAAYEF